MSIDKVMSSIAADREQIETNLEALAKAGGIPSQSKPGLVDDAIGLLASIVAEQFAQAAARLNAISDRAQTASVSSPTDKNLTEKIIDVSDYKEVSDEA